MGHGINHIEYVIKRSIEFAKEFDDIDLNMVYVVASFHDLAHHIDKDNHEILSAKLFYENEEMQKYFDEEKRKIIKEAIEDHRASLKSEPRSIYGKIVSSADRNVDIITTLKRIHSYTNRYYPNLNIEEMIDRAYEHMKDKFGNNGYAKVYCHDEEFEKFQNMVDELLKNRYEFTVKYMEINEIMDIKEKAKMFAMQAHMGQVRKSEPDKPLIVHPIRVGKLLEELGYDDNVVAAGYLHDVVEDTKYEIEDIDKEFGKDIATLVMDASESDKSLPWEERKKETIEKVKKLPLRNKLVIAADKIDNLEDLFLKFEKSGQRDFRAFKKGEENQKWYYTNIYLSLIENEDINLPIFLRLKDILDKVFNKKENLFLKNKIFNDNLEHYAKLKKIHAEKMELQKLKTLVNLSKPFVIEFMGTPRTGKTTIINNLYDFFKKGGFDVDIIEEFTTSNYYKQELKEKWAKMSVADRNIAIIEAVSNQLQESISKKKDVILIDRSLNDRQVWNYRCLIKNDMEKDLYLSTKEKYLKISKQMIDFLVITYADALTALKRDYNAHLALEKRSFLNETNLQEYNDCLEALKDLWIESVDNLLLLDTSSIKVNDVTIEVSNQILPAMRKKYIKTFKDKYNLK